MGQTWLRISLSLRQPRRNPGESRCRGWLVIRRESLRITHQTYSSCRPPTYRDPREAPMERFEIQTHQRNEFVEVTDRVRRAVHASSVKRGICIVYCPHTTA